MVTAEGTFIHLGDLHLALRDDALVAEGMQIIAGARTLKATPVQAVRGALVHVLNEASGIAAKLKRQAAVRMVIEDGQNAEHAKANDSVGETIESMRHERDDALARCQELIQQLAKTNQTRDGHG